MNVTPLQNAPLQRNGSSHSRLGLPSVERSTSLKSILETFGIPAARFNKYGTVEYVSSSAADLFGECIEELLQEAALLVRRLIDRAASRGHATPLVLALPSHDGMTTLRAQTCGWIESEDIIVLFLAARRSPTPSTSAWGLSARENVVAHQISIGASTKTIACRLGLSVHTVRRHTERVFAKLGVQSRLQVVVLLRASKCPPTPI